MLTSDKSLIENLMILPVELSDHSPIIFKFKMGLERCKPLKNRTYFQYNKTNMKLFSDKVYDLSEKLKSISGDNINLLWDTFHDSMRCIIQETIPKTTYRKKNLPPWMNKTLKSVIRSQRVLYKKYKSTGNETLLGQYREKQRDFRNKVRKAKRSYLKKNIMDPLEKGESKPFFTYFKALHNPEESTGITLVNEEKKIVDPIQVASLLNSFFQKQFNPNFFLREDSFVDIDRSCQDVPMPNSMQVDSSGVVNKLHVKNVAGPDQLNPTILKLAPESMAECLTIIFNASFQNGSVPDQWKQSNVTPIFKSGKRESVNNYRPISPTSIPCKISEHLILKEINNKIDEIISEK